MSMLSLLIGAGDEPSNRRRGGRCPVGASRERAA